MNVYEQTRGCKNHDLLIVKATAPFLTVLFHGCNNNDFIRKE